MENILATVKKAAGVSIEDDSFDVELIMFINGTLTFLSRLGISEADAHPIVSEDDVWSDLLGNRTDLECVKTYMSFKTRLMFDPPTNSAALQSLKEVIAELEWTLANLKTNKGGITSE